MQPVITSLKAIKLVRHDLPFINPGWLFVITFLSFTWPELASRRICSQPYQEHSEADQPIASSTVIFEVGSDVWGFGGLSVTSSNGQDILKLMEPSPASSLRGIPTDASTFYVLPFCEWAVEDPCSPRLGAMLALHSVHWNSFLLCLMYAEVLIYYSSSLKFWAQLMLF